MALITGEATNKRLTDARFHGSFSAKTGLFSKNYFGVLTNNDLSFYKEPSSENPQEVIPLPYITNIVKRGSLVLAFTIAQSKTTWTLTWKKNYDRECWSTHLAAAINGQPVPSLPPPPLIVRGGSRYIATGMGAPGVTVIDSRGRVISGGTTQVIHTGGSPYVTSGGTTRVIHVGGRDPFGFNGLIGGYSTTTYTVGSPAAPRPPQNDQINIKLEGRAPQPVPYYPGAPQPYYSPPPTGLAPPHYPAPPGATSSPSAGLAPPQYPAPPGATSSPHYPPPAQQYSSPPYHATKTSHYPSPPGSTGEAAPSYAPPPYPAHTDTSSSRSGSFYDGPSPDSYPAPLSGGYGHSPYGAGAP